MMMVMVVSGGEWEGVVMRVVRVVRVMRVVRVVRVEKW